MDLGAIGENHTEYVFFATFNPNVALTIKIYPMRSP